MIRSALALAALLGLAISSGAAYACPYMDVVSSGKQTVASADGQSKPVVLPTTKKDG